MTPNYFCNRTVWVCTFSSVQPHVLASYFSFCIRSKILDIYFILQFISLVLFLFRGTFPLRAFNAFPSNLPSVFWTGSQSSGKPPRNYPSASVGCPARAPRRQMAACSAVPSSGRGRPWARAFAVKLRTNSGRKKPFVILITCGRSNDVSFDVLLG